MLFRLIRLLSARRSVWATLGLSLLLAGCAIPLTTEVSRFNAWNPELAQSRFAFVRPVDPSRELEQASYEALVEAELKRLGLTRALPGQMARIQVDMSLTTQADSRPTTQPVYDNAPVYFPPRRDAQGRLHPGYWGPDPAGPRLVGHQQVNVAVQVSTLRLRLLDAGANPRQPHTVYESTSKHEALGSTPLVQIAPWLVRAVFDEFPGPNGQVRQVRFNTKTGEVMR